MIDDYFEQYDNERKAMPPNGTGEGTAVLRPSGASSNMNMSGQPDSAVRRSAVSPDSYMHCASSDMNGQPDSAPGDRRCQTPMHTTIVNLRMKIICHYCMDESG